MPDLDGNENPARDSWSTITVDYDPDELRKAPNLAGKSDAELDAMFSSAGDAHSSAAYSASLGLMVAAGNPGLRRFTDRNARFFSGEITQTRDYQANASGPDAVTGDQGTGGACSRTPRTCGGRTPNHLGEDRQSPPKTFGGSRTTPGHTPRLTTTDDLSEPQRATCPLESVDTPVQWHGVRRFGIVDIPVNRITRGESSHQRSHPQHPVRHWSPPVGRTLNKGELK